MQSLFMRRLKGFFAARPKMMTDSVCGNCGAPGASFRADTPNGDTLNFCHDVCQVCHWFAQSDPTIASVGNIGVNVYRATPGSVPSGGTEDDDITTRRLNSFVEILGANIDERGLGTRTPLNGLQSAIKTGLPLAIEERTNALRDLLRKNSADLAALFATLIQIPLRDMNFPDERAIRNWKTRIDEVVNTTVDDPRRREIDEKYSQWLQILNISNSYETFRVSMTKRTSVVWKDLLKELVGAFVDLREMVGLNSLKDALIDRVLSWIESPRKFSRGYFNMLLLGRPGTGKTTVGKLIPRIYSALGMFSPSFGETKVISSEVLVAPFEGQTRGRVTRFFMSNVGRPVLWDEAYDIIPEIGNSTFGAQAVDTLVGLFSDFEGVTMWLMAGYADDIQNRLLRANPGLARRVRDRFYFENYTPAELYTIYERIHRSDFAIDARGTTTSQLRFVYTEDAEKTLKDSIEATEDAGLFYNSNAGGIRALYRQITETALVMKKIADSDEARGKLVDFSNFEDPRARGNGQPHPIQITESIVRRGFDKWVSSINENFFLRWEEEDQLDPQTFTKLSKRDFIDDGNELQYDPSSRFDKQSP